MQVLCAQVYKTADHGMRRDILSPAVRTSADYRFYSYADPVSSRRSEIDLLNIGIVCLVTFGR